MTAGKQSRPRTSPRRRLLGLTPPRAPERSPRLRENERAWMPLVRADPGIGKKQSAVAFEGIRAVMSDVDIYVSEVAGVAAEQMTATGLPGSELRERKHLDPFMKSCLEQRSGLRPVSQTLRTPDFQGLG